MSAEMVLSTSSPLSIGQLIVAAAAVDPELTIRAHGEAFLVGEPNQGDLLALWPSVPDEVGPAPWVAEVYVLGSSGRATPIIEVLREIGAISSEEES